MYRVLIADDEQLMREALRIMISKVKNFEVAACVSNGKDAVEYCKEHIVDIIFMDIIMPEKTGVEASKEILVLNPAINIYILSAYSNFEFAKEALRLKINEYILKPVSFSKIKNILNDYHNCYGISFKQSEFLFSLVNESDYNMMYLTVPKVVEEIYVTCGQNIKQLQNTFQNLQKNLFYISKWIEESQIKKEEFFSISEFTLQEKKRMEFWLFKVMDFVFQKNGIHKYPVLKDVFEYIELHIKENIGLSDITKECAISQGYLSRIFKLCFRVSVMEYLHIKKLILAKAYLCFTKYSVAEISFRLGYNESNYFGKVFKKFEHITAHQYRKNLTDETSVKYAGGGGKNE